MDPVSEAHQFEAHQHLLNEMLPGRVRLVNLLGCGRWGAVYSAYVDCQENLSAVKITHGGLPDDRRTRDVYKSLLHVVRLRHPALTAVQEVHFSRRTGQIVLVMEHIHSIPVHRYLAENALHVTVGRLTVLLEKIADGIDAIHRHSLIHRDIKPDNILYDLDRSQPRITDFGLALLVDDTVSQQHSAGTPAYIAPEQIVGTGITPLVDVYSFAMTTYFLMTRSLAYDFTDARELLYARLHQDPIPLRDRNGSWPHDAEQVVMRSLSRDPSARHPTATSFATELTAALQSLTPLRLASFFDGSLSPLPRAN